MKPSGLGTFGGAFRATSTTGGSPAPAKRRWFVVTPTYLYMEYVSWELGGPLVETCDVVEVEAETARDAVRFGVREMLRDRQYRGGYCQDQRLSEACPYTGVRAEPADEEHP